MPRVVTEWDAISDVLLIATPDQEDGDVQSRTGWFGRWAIQDISEAGHILNSVRFSMSEDTRTVIGSLSRQRLVGFFLMRIDELGFKSLEQYQSSEELDTRYNELCDAYLEETLGTLNALDEDSDDEDDYNSAEVQS